MCEVCLHVTESEKKVQLAGSFGLNRLFTAESDGRDTEDVVICEMEVSVFSTLCSVNQGGTMTSIEHISDGICFYGLSTSTEVIVFPGPGYDICKAKVIVCLAG